MVLEERYKAEMLSLALKITVKAQHVCLMNQAAFHHLLRAKSCSAVQRSVSDIVSVVPHHKAALHPLFRAKDCSAKDG
jgi:hypothetical protein